MNTPRRICIMGAYESRRYEGRNNTLYHCSSAQGRHRHLTRHEVIKLIAKGEMEWVGSGNRIARYVRPRTWAKRYSDGVGVMELVPGGILVVSGTRDSDRRASAHGEVKHIEVPK